MQCRQHHRGHSRPAPTDVSGSTLGQDLFVGHRCDVEIVVCDDIQSVRRAALRFALLQSSRQPGHGSGGEQVGDHGVIGDQPVAHARDDGGCQRESPPEAKKSSCTPIEPIPRTSATTAASAPSTALRGTTTLGCEISGSSSAVTARRWTFPFGVSGTCSKNTTRAGIM